MASLDLLYILTVIYRFFAEGSSALPQQFLAFWQSVSQYSVALSLLLGVGIAYSVIRLSQVRREEREQFKQIEIAEESALDAKRAEWDALVARLESDNPNDWRAAVIDADKLVDNILISIGYPGETMGERLKAIERSDFQSLNDVWEAHKIRNRIAHEADHQLSLRDARKAIAFYERALEELEYL